MKHDFEGEHSYVLVRTSNLPNNLPDIYIESINTPVLDQGGDSQHENDSSSEEEQKSREGDDDDDDDDDSKEHDEHHRLQELKIRVYNHTVEFKKNRKLIVCINTLTSWHFTVAQCDAIYTQTFVKSVWEITSSSSHFSSRCYNCSEEEDVICAKLCCVVAHFFSL